MASAKHETKIKACKCRHTFQDQLYGPGKRLHNVTVHTGKSNKTITRCTVCGAEETR